MNQPTAQHCVYNVNFTFDVNIELIGYKIISLQFQFAHFEFHCAKQCRTFISQHQNTEHYNIGMVNDEGRRKFIQ